MPNILVIVFSEFSYQVLRIKQKSVFCSKSYVGKTVCTFHRKLNFILVGMVLPQILVASFPNPHCTPISEIPEHLSFLLPVEGGLPATPTSAPGLGRWMAPCQPPPCCVLCCFPPATLLCSLLGFSVPVGQPSQPSERQ